MFLQIRSVHPLLLSPHDNSRALCSRLPSLRLPSESGQLAASQTDLSREGQRSHGCGSLLYPPGRLAKVIMCVTALALPTTLSFLVLKPSILLISSGDGRVRTLPLPHRRVQPHSFLCERRTSVLASLPPSLRSHCRGWLVGAPAVD